MTENPAVTPVIVQYISHYHRMYKISLIFSKFSGCECNFFDLLLYVLEALNKTTAQGIAH